MNSHRAYVFALLISVSFSLPELFPYKRTGLSLSSRMMEGPTKDDAGNDMATPVSTEELAAERRALALAHCEFDSGPHSRDTLRCRYDPSVCTAGRGLSRPRCVDTAGLMGSVVCRRQPRPGNYPANFSPHQMARPQPLSYRCAHANASARRPQRAVVGMNWIAIMILTHSTRVAVQRDQS